VAVAEPDARDRLYVHGYAPGERDRRLRQAEFWRDRLLLRDVHYQAGERLLEIGCATGATLGVLGLAFPGLQLAGVDIEARQIASADAHLAGLGLRAKLRVRCGESLPWGDGTFDHVYVIWLLEHVLDPRPILSEARRVLRPGGTITVTETDYASFHVHPNSADYEYLRQAQHDLFARNGNPIAGRMLGPLLASAGFVQVESMLVGFHFFTPDGSDVLLRYVAYASVFMAGEIGPMVRQLGCDGERLSRGLAFFRSLPDQRAASSTQLVFRARGIKPARRGW
jgi:ubiquinone/menaquinone biosynthesis C-methylase UbiE